MLATDNDGIWPLEQCPMNHPHHHSLAGEYCKAIHLNFIKEEKVLREAIKTGVDYRFTEINGMKLLLRYIILMGI